MFGNRTHSQKYPKLKKFAGRIILATFATALVAIFISAGISANAFIFQSKNEVAEVYSLGASGDWKNEFQAVMLPEVGEEGEAGSFSGSNSAIYEGGAQEIVLSDFSATRDELESLTEDEEIISDLQQQTGWDNPEFHESILEQETGAPQPDLDLLKNNKEEETIQEPKETPEEIKEETSTNTEQKELGNWLEIASLDTAYLNVRGEASAEREIIGKVKPGETYQYEEEKDGWYKIKINEKKNGWVFGEYVILKNSPEDQAGIEKTQESEEETMEENGNPDDLSSITKPSSVIATPPWRGKQSDAKRHPEQSEGSLALNYGIPRKLGMTVPSQIAAVAPTQRRDSLAMTNSSENSPSFLEKIARFFSGNEAKAREKVSFGDLIGKEFVSSKIKMSFAVVETPEQILSEEELNKVLIEETSDEEGDVVPLDEAMPSDSEPAPVLPEEPQDETTNQENKTTEPEEGATGFLMEKIRGLFGTSKANAEEKIGGEESSSENDMPFVDTDIDAKIIIWYSLDGENWEKLDTITQSSTSNAENGGYFAFDAPFLKNWQDLKNLRVKMEGAVGGETAFTAYLDSVWAEVEYEGAETEKKNPQMRLPKKDWQKSEQPQLEITDLVEEKSILERTWEETTSVFTGDSTAPEIKVKLTDSSGRKIELERDKNFTVKENEDPVKVEILPGGELPPGKYAVEVSVSQEGEEYFFNDEFTWGVLAINANKSIYAPEETGKLFFAVLDEMGDMVCNASLKLNIKYQKLNINDELSTENGKIKVNEEICNLHGFTLEPDYEAEYQWDQEGAYELTLTAETKNGTHTITDKIEVKKEITFDVERITATRIYPPSNYPVTLNIVANQNFEGEIIESVPDSFEILPPAGEKNPKFEILNPKQIQNSNNQNTKQILWEVDVKKGDKFKLEYQFNAPDVSPEFYLLGPLKFISSNINLTSQFPFLTSDNVIFQEARQWQIAADAEVPIDTTTVSAIILIHQKSGKNIVCKSDTYCYAFYIDVNDDLVYKKSTDGGDNWDVSATVLDAGTWAAMGVWYDKWTPGDSGTYVHIAYFSNADDIMYERFQTTDNTHLSTEVVIASAGAQGFLNVANDVAVSKGTDGDLYAATVDVTAPTAPANFTHKCPVSSDCTLDASWVSAGANPWDGVGQDTDGNHSLVILPLPDDASHDLGDMMLVSFDVDTAANGIEYKVYDDSANSWSTNFTTILAATDSITYTHTLSGTVNPTTGALYISWVDVAGTISTSVVKSYKYSGGSWSALISPRTAVTNYYVTESSIGIDSSTNDLYVVYSRGLSATANDVFYSKSVNDGSSWSMENLLSSGADRNHRAISIDNYNASRLYAIWHDLTNFDLYGNSVVVPVTTITVSGTVYTDEAKTTPIADGRTVHLFVNSTDYSTTTTSSGDYSFSTVTVVAGDSVIAYLDGVAEDGSVVTLAIDATTAIDNLDIITGHISLEHRATGPITNSDLEDIDDSDAGDEDGITVDTGATFADGFELYVLSGENYTPGASVICDDFELEGTGTFAPAANAITVSGDWEFSSSGTFTTSGTVTFDGALAQTIITGTKTFSGLTLNNTGTAGGDDDITISGALDVDGNFNITNGDLVLTSGNPNVNTAGDVAIGADAFITPGSGTWTFDGASGTHTLTDSSSGEPQNLGAVVINNGATGNVVSTGSNIKVTTLNITADDTLDISSDTLTISSSGTPFVKSGTFTITGSTVIYSGTSATNITAVAYNNLALTPASGSVTYSLAGDLTVANAMSGTLTISSGATLDTTVSSYDITLGGSWSNSGTFTRNSSVVTFNGTVPGLTITDGGSPFYNIAFSGAGGEWLYANGSSTVANSTSVSAGTPTLLNVKAGTVSVTGGTLNVDWYLGTHAVNAAATGTNIDTGDADIVISEASSASAVWRHNGSVWGSAAASQTTGTAASGINPQPNADGAIRIREYSMTASASCPGAGCTLYRYNEQIVWTGTYGEYDYYDDYGENYLTSCWAGSTSACSNDTTDDDVIGAGWYRSAIDTMNTPYDTVNTPPTQGSWYVGMLEAINFDIDSFSKDFGTITPGGDPTDIPVPNTLTVTTSASHGYVIYAREEQPLACSASAVCGIADIDDWGAPNNLPITWSGGSFGFGYSTNDYDLQAGEGDIDRFSGPKFAGFIGTGFGDPVADRSGPTKTADGANDITYRVAAEGIQNAGPYQTSIYYVVVPIY